MRWLLVGSSSFPWPSSTHHGLAAAQPSAPTPPQQDVTPSPQEVKKVTPGAPFKPSQVLHVDVDLALVNTVGVMRGPNLSCHSSGTG